jgi:hypothetical protein
MIKIFNKKTVEQGSDKQVTVEQGSDKQVTVEQGSDKQVTVEEVHETFFTEVDRLLEEARVSHTLESDKQELIDKCERLKKLGFKQCQEVQEAQSEIARLTNLKQENIKKGQIIDAINYFGQKYPLYKFITEESVKKICNKYGLIYCEIDKYIGAIPDKNLKEMEDFKISDDDIPVTIYHYPHGSNITSLEHAKMTTNMGTYSYHIPLKTCIAAPIKYFNTSGMEIKDYKLVKIPVDDPIVLQPVIFREVKYFLIKTAWGKEAGDEDMVNQNFN